MTQEEAYTYMSDFQGTISTKLFWAGFDPWITVREEDAVVIRPCGIILAGNYTYYQLD